MKTISTCDLFELLAKSIYSDRSTAFTFMKNVTTPMWHIGYLTQLTLS